MHFCPKQIAWILTYLKKTATRWCEIVHWSNFDKFLLLFDKYMDVLAIRSWIFFKEIFFCWCFIILFTIRRLGALPQKRISKHNSFPFWNNTRKLQSRNGCVGGVFLRHKKLHHYKVKFLNSNVQPKFSKFFNITLILENFVALSSW